MGAVTWDEVKAACPDWAQNVLMAGYRGSESHGTTIDKGDLATDDVDVFAISVQKPDWYVALTGYSNKARQHYETSGAHLDLLVYDVRKFFSLLASGNPNVHVALWLRDDHYLHMTEMGRRVIEARTLFLSTSCLNALCGYATAQIGRMNKDEYHGYMGAKRKALADRFGFDAKMAAHALRLLYMGIELVQHGTLWSWRPDQERELLMQVKRGEWSLEQVKAHVDKLWAEYRALEASAKLPEYPNWNAINALLVDVIHTVGAQ